MANDFEKHLLGIVCNVFDAHAVLLFLPQEDGDKYRLGAFYSQDEDIVLSQDLEKVRGVAGWILRNRQPLLVANLDPGEHTPGYYDDPDHGIRSFMGAPLAAGGALCADSTRQYCFSERDLNILKLFADQISRHESSRGRQELAGDLPRYFAQLGVIQDLRFRYRSWPKFIANYIRTLAEATGFDYCAFASVVEPGQSYCLECESASLMLDGAPSAPLSMHNGLIGWVFLNGQPVEIDSGGSAASSSLFGKVESMPEFGTVICMPVPVNRSTRGVVCLANLDPRAADEGLRSFLRQAVDHLTIFLENLYLRARLQSMMPSARIHTRNVRRYDPDNPPARQDAENWHGRDQDNS